MIRELSFLLSCTAFVVAAIPDDDVPHPPAAVEVPATQSVGLWSIHFSNDVSEECEIRRDGTASVVEPLRSSLGQVVSNGQTFVILFKDDRVERWTAIRGRFVVEHWASSSQWPASTPVLGIAERIE